MGVADVAQVVEQVFCKHWVGGSSPFIGFYRVIGGEWRSLD
jgi:hypothetical protein